MSPEALRSIVLVVALWPAVPFAAEKVPCRNLRPAADCAREEAAVNAAMPGGVTVSKDKVSEVQAASGVVHLEKLEILPDPEDIQAPQATRWQKMERALGRGRSAKPIWMDSYDNSGVRLSCRDPCPPWPMMCCVGSGGFSIAHPSAKGAL